MTPTPALTRRAEIPADAGFRLALFLDSRQPQDRMPGLDAALADQVLRHQFAGQEASYRAAYPGARHEIVEVDGVPVGRLVLDEGASAWTVIDIAILESWRGRGLGTRILSDVTAGAREAGVPVRLRVMAHNVRAQQLYTRLGFTLASTSEFDFELVWRAAG